MKYIFYIIFAGLISSCATQGAGTYLGCGEQVVEYSKYKMKKKKDRNKVLKKQNKSRMKKL